MNFLYIFLILCVTRFHSFKPNVRVLVLGGTGFVGRSFINELVVRFPNSEIVSISRRGILSGETNLNVKWISGDINEVIESVFQNYGPFDICVHTVGILLDNGSGLSKLNKFMSGSGSQPDMKSSYDYITRLTATNAIDLMKSQSYSPIRKPTFIFISAAEAGWTIRPLINWLARYLDAKRAVENQLSSNNTWLRSIVFRPSLIWSPNRLQALPSVIPFYLGNIIGIPFVDRPVFLSSITRAMVAVLEDESVQGIQRYQQIEYLAKRCSN
jgi:nucleoside-diphosphate-sugar epimerase